ncbi:CAP domain-containing protein [Butyrivibrio sp. MC2013]|uniref:CAP domain-containing protein n=1 Tax=Butyrivibrio sp. MC2013 TaxID=1280686 RepID=UPI00040D870F|nr:CAP domain-containing protein [Butyrivibrio sp. MC2013]
MKNSLRSFLKALLTVAIVIVFTISPLSELGSSAQQIPADFDYKYYADSYPDLKAAFGYDKEALWHHYENYGRKENRKCSSYDASVLGALRPDSSDVQSSDAVSLDLYSSLLFDKINAYRTANGLAALQVRDINMQVAELRTAELPGKFDHKRPDGRTFGSSYVDLGYDKPYCGENLCLLEGNWDFNKDGDVYAYVQYIFDGYKASPSHNRCMLNPAWNYIGAYFIVNSGGCSYNAVEFSQ